MKDASPSQGSVLALYHRQEKHDSQHRLQGKRQDLDESDADGTKLYNECKRGELLIHGEDTCKKIKLNLKAMNEIFNTEEF